MNLTKDDKLDKTRIRNLKNCERHHNDSDVKVRKKYRTYESMAYSFINITKEEHLEELARLFKNKLNNK